MGIPQIWVIDPEDGSCSRYQERQLLRNDKFAIASKGIEFDITQIGDLLD